MTELLHKRGMLTELQPGCPVSHVHLSRNGQLIAVTLEEEQQPLAARSFTTSSLAATFIESSVWRDVVAPLLLAHPVTIAVTLAPPARPPGPRFILAAAGEAAFAIDRSIWAGASLLGCARVGPSCLGLLALVEDEVAASTRAERIATNLLAAAAFPLHFRRVTLTPEIGVGISWVRATLRHDGASASVDFSSLRASAGLHLSVRLGYGLFADLGVALDANVTSGDSVTLAGIDADDVQDGTTQLLPPPWGMLRTGLGLRWSSR